MVSTFLLPGQFWFIVLGFIHNHLFYHMWAVVKPSFAVRVAGKQQDRERQEGPENICARPKDFALPATKLLQIGRISHSLQLFSKQC